MLFEYIVPLMVRHKIKIVFLNNNEVLKTIVIWTYSRKTHIDCAVWKSRITLYVEIIILYILTNVYELL